MRQPVWHGMRAQAHETRRRGAVIIVVVASSEPIKKALCNPATERRKADDRPYVVGSMLLLKLVIWVRRMEGLLMFNMTVL